LKPHGFATARFCLCRPAEVTQRIAEVEVGISMGGIDGQNLAIRCLSLQQPSGPMVDESPLK
jgi:hypothetical protein